MTRFRLPRLTIARKGFLLISIPLVTQLIFGAAVLVIGRNAVAAHDWELHSQQVLSRAYGVKASLLTAQSSIRGYVVSGNRSYQSRFESAAREVPGEMTALLKLVADNPQQAPRARRMEGGANEFLQFQSEQEALVTTGQQSLAVERVSTQTGDQQMQHFLAPLNEFLGEEERLASVRHARAYESNRTANVVVAGGMLLNVALAGALAWFFTTSINRRLGVLTENARRLAQEQPLLPPLETGDEIAEVDRAFRDMAVSLTEATASLERSNSKMEAFSYSVSHDLRAPLRAINGFARIVADEYGPQLDDEARRLLGVISRNADTMAQLIDDLLAFSRLSRQPIAQSNVDMRQLAERAFSDAARAAPERGIELVLGTIPPARGDLAMLRQVYANLLSNAVKFTAPREHARVELGSSEGKGERVYFVKDNGVGFDMRYVNKLFGVFQRLHEANQFEGTGVGLAIVQRVVHRHGGRVWAESTLGEGATFYFTLRDNQGGGNV